MWQKGGGALAIFMFYWMNSNIFTYYELTSAQHSCTVNKVFMSYENFEYTNDVTLHK